MKKKLKGLLSLWLAVVLVLGTPTVPVLAAGTDHEGHTNDAGWKNMGTSFTDESEGKYFIHNSSGNVIDSCGAVVSSNKSVTICLNGKSLGMVYGAEDYCKIDVNGTLTMDDCSVTQGECFVPFEVESSGILNLERGKYIGSATVSANSVMNIKGGTYAGDITVDPNGVLNISTENGRTTKVYIDCPAAGESGKNIIGKFNLSDPQKNYSTDVNGKTKIFDSWKVQQVDSGGTVCSSKIISAKENYTVGAIKNDNSDFWSSVGYNYVYLYSDWVDGHTVTYNYNGSGDSDKTIGVVSGNTITLETPTRTGFTFNGWKKDTEESIISGGTSFKPTANTTLTAQWIQTPSSGGVNDPVNPPTSDPTPVTPPNPTPTPTLST